MRMRKGAFRPMVVMTGTNDVENRILSCS